MVIVALEKWWSEDGQNLSEVSKLKLMPILKGYHRTKKIYLVDIHNNIIFHNIFLSHLNTLKYIKFILTRKDQK